MGALPKPLEALERMHAKDYFKDNLQIEFVQAVGRGNKELMMELLQRGADVNASGSHGMKPLFWALGKQNLDGFEFLLENNANPNIKIEDPPEGRRSISVVELAAIAENSAYLCLLLKHGADPNRDVGYGGRTVIYEAILNNRIENVKLLIQAGADINHKDLSGSTPLMTAAGIKNFDMVYLLLKSGADAQIKNRWGNDLLWMLKEFGDSGISRKEEQYRWYRKVKEELHHRGLLE